MLSEAVAGAAQRFPGRVAVATPRSQLTYGELDHRARLLGGDLASRGVRAGDVVALVLPSGPEWAVAAVAVDRGGAAIAGVSPVASPGERAGMVAAAGARLVVAGPGLLDGLPLRSPVVVVGPDGSTVGGSTVGGSTVGGGHHARDEPPEVAEHRRDDGRPFAVCFTSGTTGAPKAALFRVRQARAVQRIDLGPGAESRWDGGSPMISSTQFAHVGFVLKFPWYARLGCTLHVMDRWRADDALRLLAEHRMPTLGVVAPQLALILRSPLLDGLDLSALRLVIAGGAASPPALVAEARRRLGVDYSIRWSSTESGGVGLLATIDSDDDPAVATVGRPRDGVEARVADDEGRPAAPGTVGELQLRSPAVMDGYWHDAPATAAAFTDDGWLRTGDLARLDGAGRFVLAGRRSDMYIRGGYNVHPAEVEAAIGRHPGVAAVAVVARPDDIMGELGVAVVVPRDPARPPTLESLREFGAASLARHKLPEALVVLDRLPLTTADKVDRRRLAEMVAPPPAAGAPDAVGHP